MQSGLLINSDFGINNKNSAVNELRTHHLNLGGYVRKNGDVGSLVVEGYGRINFLNSNSITSSQNNFIQTLQHQIDTGLFRPRNPNNNADDVFNHFISSVDRSADVSKVEINSSKGINSPSFNIDAYYNFKKDQISFGPFAGFSLTDDDIVLTHSYSLGNNTSSPQGDTSYNEIAKMELKNYRAGYMMKTVRVGANLEINNGGTITNVKTGQLLTNRNNDKGYDLSLRLRGALGFNMESSGWYSETDKNIINSGAPLSAPEFKIRDVNNKMFNELLASAVFSNKQVSWTLNYQTDTYNGTGKDRNHAVTVGVQINALK